MKFHIELDAVKGLCIAAEISPLLVRYLLPIIAGGLSLPWLIQLGRGMGWL